MDMFPKPNFSLLFLLNSANKYFFSMGFIPITSKAKFRNFKAFVKVWNTSTAPVRLFLTCIIINLG